MRPINRQATLKSPALCGGIALHMGEHVKLTLKPAPIGTGIIFVRSDVTDRDNRIMARPDAVCDVRNCTKISNAAGVTVGTIEHLMAALAASGVDNLIIEVDGPELPAMDGSSEPYLKLIEAAQIERQNAPRRYVEVLKPVFVQLGDATASIAPHSRLRLDVAIEYAEAAIGKQRVVIEPDTRSFRDRLASARTFARQHEVAALQDAGLGLGGSLDNAVVVDEDRVLNPEGLRFDDEFVRHKALDLLGDLYIAGPILGQVTTHRGGHAINHALLIALFADPTAWRFTNNRVTISDEMVTVAPSSVLEEASA
ncbi:UDP-3-O-acyl-N-acetylglucosamine deacetylase [Robiginitomaculum antarcticum]|uniref:UDP-3-O-acyl-N-acetylglucosamine deacetylase n=1 Tax=Robiginitomaculum antarcticum TaxID=437507 RepID=UPI00039E4C62|nr:UDP-3-O-acyl-N-acetylglucosamine deacetylase [Robiginitomaculum antarcticum]